MTTRLAPRAERLDLSFPVTFHDGEALLQGHCLNLSQSGLLATFAQPPDLWILGSLTLSAGHRAAVLPARVARVDGQQAGIAFIFEVQAQRDVVHQLLALARAKTQLVGQPPF